MVHETGSKLIKLTCFIQLIKCKGYQRPELVSSIMYIVSCRHEADLRIVLRNMWTLYTLQHTHQNIHAKHAIIERKKIPDPNLFVDMRNELSWAWQFWMVCNNNWQFITKKIILKIIIIFHILWQNCIYSQIALFPSFIGK